MRQSIFIIIGLVIILTGCGSVKSLSEMSLVGTTWFYKDNTHEWKYEITFLENGVMKTTHPNDTSPENDEWSQEKTKLELSFNGGYALYKGKIIKQNKITGEATNSKNKK